MKTIIYKAQANAKRIKIFIPYKRNDFRDKIKKLNTSFWHANQKLWSVVNTQENLDILKNIFGDEYYLKDEKLPKQIKKRPLNKVAIDALFDLEKTLTLNAYSKSTIDTYKNMLVVYFSKFMDYDIKQITKKQIEGFIYQLIKENKISETYQNQMINAIKAYYEHVLGKSREFYDINRPKRNIDIPNILSEKEVLRIIQYPDNLKHRAILWTIYSAG